MGQAKMDFALGTIAALLKKRALEEPRKPFLFFKDEIWSRQDLDRASDAVHEALERLGIKTGERAALLLPNGPEFLIYFFAILKAGGIAVPVNTALKIPEIEFILKDSGASLAFAAPGIYEAARAAARSCPLLRRVETVDMGRGKNSWTQALAARPAERLLEPEATASLIYTSGTTGFPKGARLSHRNYLFDVRRFVSAIGMNAEDRFLCFLPLFHVNAQVVTLLSPLYSGGGMVLMEKFSPKEFFESLERARATAFSAVPSVYSVLLNLPDSSRYDLSSLRFCICGAAPMPVEVFERFEKKFNAFILEGYGLSEGTCVSSVNPPPPRRRKIGSIGLPLEGQDMKIVAASGGDAEPGAVGEIVVRGLNVMQDYWNRPEETARTIKDGWLHTGDLGYQDSDGYFFIVGRSKEMIIRGGENIYPKEVEEALYKHPAVLEAAVVGLPDERWGETVAAFIVLKEGPRPSAKDITLFLKNMVADYKIPRRVDFVSSLPKTATGKIKKLELRRDVREREGLE